MRCSRAVTLPGAASQFAHPDDIAKLVSCGPDVTAHVAAARPFVEAGSPNLALVQIGGAPQRQEPLFDYVQDELLPALRTEFGVG